MSCLWKVKRRSCLSPWRLRSLPVIRLSIATTAEAPSARTRSHRCDPRNPEPPRTTTRLFSNVPAICGAALTLQFVEGHLPRQERLVLLQHEIDALSDVLRDRH